MRCNGICCLLQLQLRDMRLGTKRHDRRRSYDMLEVAELEHQTLQYLYSEGGIVCLMSFAQMNYDAAGVRASPQPSEPISSQIYDPSYCQRSITNSTTWPVAAADLACKNATATLEKIMVPGQRHKLMKRL